MEHKLLRRSFFPESLEPLDLCTGNFAPVHKQIDDLTHQLSFLLWQMGVPLESKPVTEGETK